MLHVYALKYQDHDAGAVMNIIMHVTTVRPYDGIMRERERATVIRNKLKSHSLLRKILLPFLISPSPPEGYGSLCVNISLTQKKWGKRLSWVGILVSSEIDAIRCQHRSPILKSDATYKLTAC